jgi:hypothetical protein
MVYGESLKNFDLEDPDEPGPPLQTEQASQEKPNVRGEPLQLNNMTPLDSLIRKLEKVELSMQAWNKSKKLDPV